MMEFIGYLRETYESRKSRAESVAATERKFGSRIKKYERILQKLGETE